MGKLASVLVAAGLVVGGLLVALGLAEAGFRLYELRQPVRKTFFWVPRPAYGWGLAPGRTGAFFADHGEFRTHVRINSHGLRDVDHEYAKEPGVYRILILGDSFMEAMQVELEQGFARLLEEHLRIAAGDHIEVINTGVSAWGTDNELLFFREEGYKYQADLVLLGFTTANDVRENYEPFNRQSAITNLAKPHFQLAADGSLEQMPGEPSPPPVPWWREHVRVGQYLYRRLGGGVVLPGAKHRAAADKTAPADKAVPADMLVYKPDEPPEVREAWEVTEALLSALQRDVEEQGAHFAVMLINGRWVHSDRRWKVMLFHAPGAAGSWDRAKPNRRLGRFFVDQRVPVVDLFDRFESAKEEQPLFFTNDPHWTPAGHALAADEAASFLIKRGLVPRAIAEDRGR